MYKRIIIFVLSIFTSFSSLFSTYVNLKAENNFTNINLSIYDYSNKLSLKIKNNKIEEVNSFQFKGNFIEIKKNDLFYDHGLTLKVDNDYYIKYENKNLAFFKLFKPLVECDFDISFLVINGNNFNYQSIFYYKYKDKNIGFYYDYTNLNFTVIAVF